MKLYVGNLPFKTTENDLQDLFEKHGEVKEVALIMDKATNRSRGFAFVTMGSNEEGKAALAALNGKSFDGRELLINEARPREDRPQRSFAGSGPRR